MKRRRGYYQTRSGNTGLRFNASPFLLWLQQLLKWHCFFFLFCPYLSHSLFFFLLFWLKFIESIFFSHRNHVRQSAWVPGSRCGWLLPQPSSHRCFLGFLFPYTAICFVQIPGNISSFWGQLPNHPCVLSLLHFPPFSFPTCSSHLFLSELHGKRSMLSRHF